MTKINIKSTTEFDLNQYKEDGSDEIYFVIYKSREFPSVMSYNRIKDGVLTSLTNNASYSGFSFLIEQNELENISFLNYRESQLGILPKECFYELLTGIRESVFRIS